MKQAYIVRCTATATIGEAWRVHADSPEEAVDLLSGEVQGEESAELLRDWVIEDERDRSNFDAVLEADDEDQEQTGCSPTFTQDEIDALTAAISGWCEDCDSSNNDGHFKHLDSLFVKVRRAGTADSMATVFDRTDEAGNTHRVDLLPIEQDQAS